MADALYRQWKILELIPRHPQSILINKIMGGLEEQGLEVPRYRTIQRDLNTLSAVFPYLQTEKMGGANGWFITAEDGVLEIPRMQTHTALAFYLAQKSLMNQLPPTALGHLQAHFLTAHKLLDKSSSPVASWRDKVRVVPQTQQLIAPAIEPEVLDTIYKSLLDDHCFDGKYFGRRSDQYASYRVHPLSLIFRGTVTYLVCTLNAHQDIRLLSLHRFVEALPTAEPINIPSNYDLDRYMQEGHADFLLGDYIELKMRVDEEVAIHLREALLDQYQKLELQENGQSLVTARVRDTGQLRWWLLGFAQQIEILEPAALREEFRVKTLAMASIYASP
ncbi:MAG: WYL domain-containing protein [Porticoccaceae bacterium]